MLRALVIPTTPLPSYTINRRVNKATFGPRDPSCCDVTVGLSSTGWLQGVCQGGSLSRTEVAGTSDDRFNRTCGLFMVFFDIRRGWGS
jgi:hypothetical protein